VTFTISDTIEYLRRPLLVSSEEWSDTAQDHIGLDEVRRALSTISGSPSEAVFEECRERRLPKFFFDTSAVAKVYRKEIGVTSSIGFFQSPVADT
jgi:hypothetical protein